MKPRPAILLTLAYGAGLATGLLRFGDPLGAAAVLSRGCHLAGQGLATMFVTGAMLGRVSGELAWLAERSELCRRGFPRKRSGSGCGWSSPPPPRADA